MAPNASMPGHQRNARSSRRRTEDDDGGREWRAVGGITKLETATDEPHVDRPGDKLLPPARVSASRNKADDGRTGECALIGLLHPQRDDAPVWRVHPAHAGPRLSKAVIVGREK